MRLKTHALVALGALTATLAAAPAMADVPHVHLPHPHVNVQIGPGAGTYVRPAYGGGPAWQNPQVFSDRMVDRMNQMQNDLQFRVRRGAVSQQALQEFDARRQHIMGDLNVAAQDGVITPAERNHVRVRVDSLQDVARRYRTGYPGAYGGGPHYYHRHHGDWRR